QMKPELVPQVRLTSALRQRTPRVLRLLWCRERGHSAACLPVGLLGKCCRIVPLLQSPLFILSH
ncbi:uncharacterized, partial [Tachysurus ichikawai]